MPGATEEHYAEMKAAVMETVGRHFSPEFINRIDEVVVFHPLDREQIRAIAWIQVGHLRQRLAERGLGLRLSDAAIERLAEAGFDPVYGARPLKRALQQRLENPLAQRILAGAFVPGDTVVVEVEGGGLLLKGERGGGAASSA